MQYPVGLATDAGGNLLMGEFNGASYEIEAFDVQGNSSGAPFSDPVGTSHPSQVLVDGDVANRRYVVNYNGTTHVYGGIGAFNADGTVYALSGTFPGIAAPGGIAYEPGNDTILITDGGGAVLSFTNQGVVKALAGAFPGVTAVNYPESVAYDPQTPARLRRHCCRHITLRCKRDTLLRSRAFFPILRSSTR